MEELRLRKLTIRTARPHDLESFLVEVFGAEITPVTQDSFLAVVANVTFDIQPGIAAIDGFEFLVSPVFLEDIRSRWEFYCYRHGAHEFNNASRTRFSCSDSEGRSWTVFTEELTRGEYPSISVRNC